MSSLGTFFRTIAQIKEIKRVLHSFKFHKNKHGNVFMKVNKKLQLCQEISSQNWRSSQLVISLLFKQKTNAAKPKTIIVHIKQRLACDNQSVFKLNSAFKLITPIHKIILSPQSVSRLLIVNSDEQINWCVKVPKANAENQISLDVNGPGVK